MSKLNKKYYKPIVRTILCPLEHAPTGRMHTHTHAYRQYIPLNKSRVWVLRTVPSFAINSIGGTLRGASPAHDIHSCMISIYHRLNRSRGSHTTSEAFFLSIRFPVSFSRAGIQFGVFPSHPPDFSDIYDYANARK